ncbi:MAG: peptidoglycan recognition family protein, partial [Herbinix sp.]|nr:peptidoglycan recognition family protein [Herbinix sp.]
QTLSNGTVIKAEYLTPNPYSRPQTRLKRIKGIVVHYTANPGSTAENNRDYFEGLADKKTTSVSSHYVIGLEGEVIQCIPLTEIAYASNDRNDDTISIECCHPDETGKFNKATYQSLVSLVSALCIEFDLTDSNIIRHYDVTGKLCPLYFVEHEDAWYAFKMEVMAETKELKIQNK